MKFSKTTGCFYPDDVAYQNPPADLVDVPREDFEVAMARAPGDTLDVVGDRIVIVPPPKPKHEELVAQAMATARQMRQPIIGILDGMQSSANTNGDTITAKAIETVKQALKDITKTDLSACVTYEDMRQAMKAAYAAIVMAAPASVVTAFASVVK